MDDRADDAFSFDPKTWVEKEKITGGSVLPIMPTASASVAPAATAGQRAAARLWLAATVSTLLLLGGAGAAYLTRTPALGTPAALR